MEIVYGILIGLIVLGLIYIILVPVPEMVEAYSEKKQKEKEAKELAKFRKLFFQELSIDVYTFKDLQNITLRRLDRIENQLKKGQKKPKTKG